MLVSKLLKYSNLLRNDRFKNFNHHRYPFHSKFLNKPHLITQYTFNPYLIVNNLYNNNRIKEKIYYLLEGNRSKILEISLIDK